MCSFFTLLKFSSKYTLKYAFKLFFIKSHFYSLVDLRWNSGISYLWMIKVVMGCLRNFISRLRIFIRNLKHMEHM